LHPDRALMVPICGDTVSYVHIRSKYTCFQCRVDRA
jgi:hypothetical protein